MVGHGLDQRCPQCGGPIPVADGVSYARCDHCGTTSFVDLQGALLHEEIRPGVPPDRVPGLVRTRAREADWPRPVVSGVKLVYEPVWELEGAGGRRVRIGARPGPTGRLALVDTPGGERIPVDRSATTDDAWIEPELAPEAAAEAAARVTGHPVSARTVRLVHQPMYVGRVRVGGEARELRVDAVDGTVLEPSFPARPAYRSRNRAWLATAAIIAVAVLPLPWAVAAAGLAALGGAWWVGRAVGGGP